MKRIEAGPDIRLSGTRVPVTVYFEPRRASRASIGRRGVHIRIPAWLSPAQREEQIRSLRRWAEVTLRKNPARFLPPAARSYRQGEGLTVGGLDFRLQVERTGRKRPDAAFEGDLLRVRLPAGLSAGKEAGLLPGLIARAAGREFRPRLEERLEALNRLHFRKQPGRVAFRDNRVLWGSCSAKGNISIATRLLLAPREVLDYVLIHELAHLVERSHSARFWRLVAAAMPAWEQSRRWLRDNQGSCRF
jgi:predicted metal-dependent hydrolase